MSFRAPTLLTLLALLACAHHPPVTVTEAARPVEPGAVCIAAGLWGPPLLRLWTNRPDVRSVIPLRPECRLGFRQRGDTTQVATEASPRGNWTAADCEAFYANALGQLRQLIPVRPGGAE